MSSIPASAPARPRAGIRIDEDQSTIPPKTKITSDTFEYSFWPGNQHPQVIGGVREQKISEEHSRANAIEFHHLQDNLKMMQQLHASRSVPNNFRDATEGGRWDEDLSRLTERCELWCDELRRLIAMVDLLIGEGVIAV